MLTEKNLTKTFLFDGIERPVDRVETITRRKQKDARALRTIMFDIKDMQRFHDTNARTSKEAQDNLYQRLES